jgi:hypothetical protein
MLAFTIIIAAIVGLLSLGLRYTGKTHFAAPIGSGNANSEGLSRYIDGRRYGNVWFVGSDVTGATNSTGYGYSPESPFATLAYAVATAAVADNDDVVIVLPGHTETITAAAGVAMSKAGVTVIGIGQGRKRPIINYTTAVGASFDITAARCWIENLVFTVGFDAITAMINVQAADVTIKGCEIDHGGATYQASSVILGNASADRLRVLDNHFHGTTDAGTNSVISLVGGNEILIAGNRILGSYHASTGVILNATTDCLNLVIDNNIIVNRTASSTKVIVLTATSTGAITNNRIGILSGTAPITAAAADLVGGNYYKAAAGVAAGTLL